MPCWYDMSTPTRETMDLREAWRKHYIAKGCNRDKAFWLAHKKTHTWPPGTKGKS